MRLSAIMRGALVFVVALLGACSPIGQNDRGVTVGPVQQATTSLAMQPHIAVSPRDPSQLAVIAISPSEVDCLNSATRRCAVNLVVATSADGGASWQEHPLTREGGSDGSVAYDADGTLFSAMMFNFGGGPIVVHRGVPTDGLLSPNYTLVTNEQLIDKPWLTIDAQTGAFLVAYTGPQGEGRDIVMLQRSGDKGATWTEPVTIGQAVQTMAGDEQIDYPPFGAQALVGTGQRLAVVWSRALAITGTLTTMIYSASSTDGGRMFAAPQEIGASWRAPSAASGGGAMYVLFKAGAAEPQELTLATSRDGGVSWSAKAVGGVAPLFYDLAPSPSIGVAPNGTIDIAFYAPQRACIDLAAFRRYVLDVRTKPLDERLQWTDTCIYDVLFTTSRDGGATFSAPVRLNAQPILGRDFVRTQNASRPGDYMGVASTEEAAHAVWVAGTHAFTARIER